LNIKVQKINFFPLYFIYLIRFIISLSNPNSSYKEVSILVVHYFPHFKEKLGTGEAVQEKAYLKILRNNMHVRSANAEHSVRPSSRDNIRIGESIEKCCDMTTSIFPYP